MKNIWSGTVPVDGLDTLAERVNKVAKRAAKVGFPAPVLTLGKKGQRPVYEPDWKGELQITHYVEIIDVAIEAPDTLKLAGWEFVGTVSAIEVGGKVEPYVTILPGIGPDLRLKGIPTPEKVNWCDHCKTFRQRTDTYLVHDGKDWKQVGSTCLKDFTGHGASEIVGYLTAIFDLPLDEDEVEGMYGSAVRFYNPREVVGFAARIVAHAGYTSKAKAEEDGTESTGEAVRRFLSCRGVEYRKMDEEYPLDDAAQALYDATFEAVEQSTSYNEWESDVVRLAKADGVQWRHVGILASAVILGLRKQERKAQAQAKGESNFLGQKGERITLNVKVTLKREFDGQYGPSYLIRMLAGESDDLIWFASWSETVEAISEGDEFTIIGTVKNHELDKRTDRPTTVLTRCKVK